MEFLKIPLCGNEQKLIDIYREVYPNTPELIPSITEFQWRFGGKPYPVQIWVARDKNKIIAVRPIAVRPIKIGDVIRPSVYMLNVMVHPAYQGKGIFRSLMEEVWRENSEKCAMAVTFPNENSIKGYGRWKEWFQLAEIPLFVRMLPPKRFSEKNSIVRFFGGHMASLVALAHREKSAQHRVSVKQVDFFDEGVQALWEKNKNGFDFVVARTREYLNWRYIERPAVKYAVYEATAEGVVIGFLVARTRTMFGMHLGLIVDFFVDDNDEKTLNEMLRKAVDNLVDKNVQAICLQFVGPRCFGSVFHNNGFCAVPKFALPRRFLMYARTGRMESEEMRYSDIRKLFCTWGDNDAV